MPSLSWLILSRVHTGMPSPKKKSRSRNTLQPRDDGLIIQNIRIDKELVHVAKLTYFHPLLY